MLSPARRVSHEYTSDRPIHDIINFKVVAAEQNALFVSVIGDTTLTERDKLAALSTLCDLADHYGTETKLYLSLANVSFTSDAFAGKLLKLSNLFDLTVVDVAAVYKAKLDIQFGKKFRIFEKLSDLPDQEYSALATLPYNDPLGTTLIQDAEHSQKLARAACLASLGQASQRLRINIPALTSSCLEVKEQDDRTEICVDNSISDIFDNTDLMRQFTEELRALVTDARKNVYLDLSSLKSLGKKDGLGSLLAARAACVRAGKEFVLLGVSHDLIRQLNKFGVQLIFKIKNE